MTAHPIDKTLKIHSKYYQYTKQGDICKNIGESFSNLPLIRLKRVEV